MSGQRGQPGFQLGQGGFQRGALLAGLGQAGQRGFMLRLGRLQFAFQPLTLPIKLGTPLLDRRNLRAMFAQGVQGLAVFQGALLALRLLFGNLRLQAGDRGLGLLDMDAEFGQLRLQGAKLAPPRNQTGGRLPRPDHERAIGMQ